MLARTLSNAAAAPLSWTQSAAAVLRSVYAVAALLIRVIPATWIYGGLTAGIALYMALFGLSAAAYRTLYLRPSLAGDRQ
jgi:xanthine/uracil/vitamin C permease (AzgA family)